MPDDALLNRIVQLERLVRELSNRIGQLEDRPAQPQYPQLPPITPNYPLRPWDQWPVIYRDTTGNPPMQPGVWVSDNIYVPRERYDAIFGAENERG